jgi:PAS domain S-box-containing protein
VVTAPTGQSPRDRAREIFGALERDGRWSGEVQNVRKDGTTFWTVCDLTRFSDLEHGEMWIAVNTEITERKAQADLLRDGEQRYRRLFEASPAALALIGPDLRLTLVNQAFSDIVGYCRDELEGMLLPDITHPGDVAICTELRARVLSGETARYRIEERLLTRQGGVVPVAFTATVIRGPDGAPTAEIAAIERLGGDER